MPLTPFRDHLRVPAVLRPKGGGHGSPATLSVRMVARRVQLHSELPPTDVWTYEGHLPGPTIEVLPEAGPALRRSVFPLDSGSTCIRWCGHPAAVSTDLARTALRLASDWTDGPGAPPWFLDSSGLAPNHWFSTPAG